MSKKQGKRNKPITLDDALEEFVSKEIARRIDNVEFEEEDVVEIKFTRIRNRLRLSLRAEIPLKALLLLGGGTSLLALYQLLSLGA